MTSADRFIPKRNTPLSQDLFNLPKKFNESPQDISIYSQKEQDELIYSNILEQKILDFDEFLNKDSEKKIDSRFDNNYSSRKKLLIFSHQKKKKNNFCSPYKNKTMIKQTKVMKSIKNSRKISKIAYKILDAPGIIDDFHMNILDWSKKNVIGISLSNNVYLFEKIKNKNKVSNLVELKDNFYTSIKFNPSGNLLACGDKEGNLDIYNIKERKKISELKLHSNRITSISWKNDKILSTGSRDKLIKSYDIRINKIIQQHKKHKQEICKIEWDKQASYLASGGNDNLICIWDARKNDPIQYYNEHKGAVRALTWSPFSFGSFISGGGTSDKSIKFWNVNKKKSLKTINTDSQVYNLIYTHVKNGFVSTHGNPGNKIMVWDGETKERISVMDGHFMRVLHLAISPNGEDVITAAGDETLKFWKVFHNEKREIVKPTCFSDYLKDLR